MTSEEIYYRRAYKGIDELREYYKYGFDKNKTNLYRQKVCIDEFNNPKITNEMLNSIKLTILIAMMGFNKEKIEQADIIDDYKDLDDSKNYANNFINENIIPEFFNMPSEYDDFKSWLRVIKCPDALKTNSKIIKKIRDSFFHSNFTLESNKRIFYTNIKNKSFFEAKILNNVFYDFVISYFSNVGTLGLVSKCEFFAFDNNKTIKNDAGLIDFIDGIMIDRYENKVNDYDGNNSPNLIIYDRLKDNCNYQVNNIVIKRALEQNGYNYNNKQSYRLTDNMKSLLYKTIHEKYGDLFYKVSDPDKKYIVSLTLEYLADTNSLMCNWFSHFYCLLSRIYDPSFSLNEQYFYGDNYALCSDDALVIIKSYLLLYRIQNSSFTDISYKDIDIDLDNDFLIWEEDSNGNKVNTNYINDAYIKVFNDNPEFTYEEGIKKLLCDIIRDSLSHSNLTIKINNFGEPIAIFKDIYKGKSKCISMTIKNLDKFVNSKAFEPRYCYQKPDQEKIR